jgi:protein-S-isoprenylcysteine O-methyltransferase Ste14
VKRQWIAYPLLFALFPVLALCSANVTEVSPSQVMVPSVVVVGGALLFMGVSWLVLRTWQRLRFSWPFSLCCVSHVGML